MTLPQRCAPGNSPSIQEMQAVAEAKLRDIQETTSDLLQQTADADMATTEEIRQELTRLGGISFVLVRLLAYGDVEKAYAIVSGDTVDDELTGLVA